MEDHREQKLFEAQQQLLVLNKNINILCSRIFKDIGKRTSKENVALLRDRLNEGVAITKIEYLDKLLHEYIGLVDRNSEESKIQIEEFSKEVEGLKIENKRLKSDLRREQEHSEELDRLNETLGGPGVSSAPTTFSIDFSGDDRVDQRVAHLESELGKARQELTTCRAKERKLRIQQQTQPTNTMATSSSSVEMLKKVTGLVPSFSGGASSNLHSEVYRFVDGVKLALEGITDDSIKSAYLKMIKQRLTGDAYELVRQITFTDEEDLIKLIKDTYLKTRSLDSIHMELWSATQKPEEDVRDFARRLKDLANSHRAIVRANYGTTADPIMEGELKKKVRRAFISGLRDKVVSSGLVYSQKTDIDGLLEDALAAQATFWRDEETSVAQRVCYVDRATTRSDSSDAAGMMAGLVAAIQQLVTTSGQTRERSADRMERGNRNENRPNMRPGRLPPCSFCNKQGHAWDECWQRRNTPYCVQCEQYGHTRKRSCGQANRPIHREYNNEGQGHRNSREADRNYQGAPRGTGQVNQGYQNPFRRDPQRNGVGSRDSSANRRDQQNGRSNDQQGNYSNQQHTARSEQSPNRPQSSNRYGNRANSRPIHCFSCGNPGHISTNCPQSHGTGN